MLIGLRDLRWVLVAAQNRSLRRAAEELNVRQSTLSRRLREIERYLGVELFERSNGGTRITSAGEEFIESARRIINEAETIRARFNTRLRGVDGRLTIGIHASFSTGNLRAVLVDFRQRYPDVEIYTVDGSSEQLLSALSRSSIDITFLAENNPPWNSRLLTVWSERVVVALPSDHALSGLETVRWSDLKGQRLLVPHRGPGSELIKMLGNKIGSPHLCNIVQHDAGLDRLLTLVGVGWGLLLAMEGATGATHPGVVFREVHEDAGPSRIGFRACWKEPHINPTLSSMLVMLRERYPDLSGDGTTP